MRYEDAPKSIGYYWLKNWCSSKPARIIKVWAVKVEHDGELFTNEDGGASIKDEMYDNHKWAGPIPEPSVI